jgi:hypothetical protein
MAAAPAASGVDTVLFAVHESDHHALGGFASRDIEVGERILAECPLAKWRCKPDLSEDMAASGLSAIIEALSPTDQQHFFALSQCEQHGSTKTALGIWASNAYPTDTGGETGMCSSVFTLACRLNHDCRPNAHACWNERIGMQTVHALRAIRKGEEVMVAYIGGDDDGTREARQRTLRSKFSFVCTCPQCGLTGSHLKASESRQRRINKIVQLLSTKPSDTLALLKERRELMDQERMPAVWGKTSALLALLWMPHTGNPATRKAAWSVATAAHACCHSALGADAQETIAFASFADQPVFAALQKKELRARGKRGMAASAIIEAARAGAPMPEDQLARTAAQMEAATAQMEAAQRALADATSAEHAATQLEVEAREKASAAVRESSAVAHELLALRNDGLRGSLWAWAPGTFDNLHISWTDFEAAAARLSDGVRRTLVHDDVEGGDLLSYLREAPYAAHWESTTNGGARADVERLKGFIDGVGCAALRNAVDAERDRTTDTRDHFAQHTLSLDRARLTALVGDEAVARLVALPMDWLSQRRDEASEHARAEARSLRHAQTAAASSSDDATTDAEAAQAPPAADATRLEAALSAARAATEALRQALADGLAPQVYLRRYSRDTRPWLNFHTDRSHVTINIAVAADATHEGGRLHAVLNGAHRIIEREEGEATVHTDDVMHAVSAMRGGVRYSLVILFFLNQ